MTLGFWYAIAAATAVLGGLAWLVKSLWILAGRGQPVLTFEVAPLFFAAAVLGVTAGSDRLEPRRRRIALTLACAGVAAGATVVATEVAGGAWNPSVVVAALAVLGGLLLQDRRGSRPQRVAWWIGALLIPSVLIGGALSLLDERLLELPLAIIAVGWIWLGALLLRQTSPELPR